ncbi:hypothetical protein AV654_19435 [Paenibacillus elgii]|uniref:Uncharacterized protein n=1 Tax=Paenibacillus elgii TaxID=189691 RepID=A0A163XMW6_9BACL|nr:hypothetical protein [Paenibacillus elgii]KZE78150.1 hypothetical protein AV654_19435 [Paenibacillus elgii]
MAWHNLTYACGHEGREQILGPVNNRAWIAERSAAGLCPDCYKESQNKRREEENCKAAEAAAKQGLKNLVGTSKQIAYAETCRQKLLKRIEQYITDESKHSRLHRYGLYQENISAANEFLHQQTSAGWWIDNREETVLDVLLKAASATNNSEREG